MGSSAAGGITAPAEEQAGIGRGIDLDVFSEGNVELVALVDFDAAAKT